MAIAFERMGGGFYVFMYADSDSGMTLAAFDPFGCGYCANENNGKPRLTSRKHGGTFSSLQGDLEKVWSNPKPLKEPIEFDLTSSIFIRFTSRLKIAARLSAQGLTEEYLFGEAPAAQEGNYLQKSLGVIKMGPERGKHNLDIDLCREAGLDALMTDLMTRAASVRLDSMKRADKARPAADDVKQELLAAGYAWRVGDFRAAEETYARWGASAKLPFLA